MSYPLEEKPTPSQAPRMTKAIEEYIHVRAERLAIEKRAIEMQAREMELSRLIATFMSEELSEVLHLAASEKWTGE